MKRPIRTSYAKQRDNMAKRGITFYKQFFKIIADAVIAQDMPLAFEIFAEMIPENQKHCVIEFLDGQYGIDPRKERGLISELICAIA